MDAAARKVIVDAGYGPDYKYFTHRLGHGMGISEIILVPVPKRLCIRGGNLLHTSWPSSVSSRAT